MYTFDYYIADRKVNTFEIESGVADFIRDNVTQYSNDEFLFILKEKFNLDWSVSTLQACYRSMGIKKNRGTRSPHKIDDKFDQAMTKELVREKYRYEDGELITLVSQPRYIGKSAGSFSSGFHRISVKGKLYKRCDLIWIYHNGDIPDNKEVYHIDNNRKNDRIENLALREYTHTVGRPKGVKESQPRRDKTSLSGRNERWIVDNWHKLTIKEFADKYGVSTGNIHAIQRRYSLPSKWKFNNVPAMRVEDLPEESGVYILITNPSSSPKAYIGSSVNIARRVKTHLREIDKGIHFCQSLMSDWNEDSYVGMVELCNECELLARENWYIEHTAASRMYNQDVQFNHMPDGMDLTKIRNKVEITPEGCWEYQGKINSNGYGEYQYRNRYYGVHRLMFFDANPEVDHNVVVRHMCHNKKCCNPSHLTSGSFSDNAKDTYQNYNETTRTAFIISYIRSRGDRWKVIEDMGWKQEVTYYKWLKKLNIKTRNIMTLTMLGETKSLKEWGNDPRRGEGVNRYVISKRIKLGWSDVDAFLTPRRETSVPYSQQDLSNVRQLHAEGVSYKDIVKKTGVPETRVRIEVGVV